MHFGVLSQWYDPEPGPPRVAGVIARGLRDLGHDVTVLTGLPNYPDGDLYDGYRQRAHQVEIRDGIPVHRVALWPSHDRSATGRALNYGSFALTATIFGAPRLRDVDAFWVYNSPVTVSVPAFFLARILRKPMVLHIQDIWPDSVVDSGLLPGGAAGVAAARVLAACCRRTYRMSEKIAVISPGMAPLLEGRGVPGEKLHLVPNAADEHLFRPTTRDSVLADELDIADDFVVMYAGGMGDVQALDSAIRAAASLRHLHDFVMVLVGSGVAEDSLRSLADNLEATNVRFLGRRPPEEMRHIMALADAQLISLRDRPLFRVTMPSKLQAVLACGLPVIAAAQGDAAAIVEQAGAGVVCRPEDDIALAQAILKLRAMSREQRCSMGGRGREFYERHLSRQCVAAGVERLLTDSVASPAKGR